MAYQGIVNKSLYCGCLKCREYLHNRLRCSDCAICCLHAWVLCCVYTDCDLSTLAPSNWVPYKVWYVCTYFCSGLYAPDTGLLVARIPQMCVFRIPTSWPHKTIAPFPDSPPLLLKTMEEPDAYLTASNLMVRTEQKWPMLVQEIVELLHVSVQSPKIWE